MLVSRHGNTGDMALRPQSIIRFEQVYLVSAALNTLVEVLSFMGISGPSDIDRKNIVLELSIVALGWVLLFFFWYFIARRASNVAKWLFVGLTVLGLLILVPDGTKLAQTNPIYAALTALITLLDFASIAFLFKRDAVDWLKSRGRIVPIDATIFS